VCDEDLVCAVIVPIRPGVDEGCHVDFVVEVLHHVSPCEDGPVLGPCSLVGELYGREGV